MGRAAFWGWKLENGSGKWKLETEVNGKWKLEMVNGNGKWKLRGGILSPSPLRALFFPVDVTVEVTSPLRYVT